MTGQMDQRYYLLALSAAKDGDLSGAVRLATRAISLNSENDKPRQLLGLCLYELGNLDAAVQVLDRFPELSAPAREQLLLTQAGLEEIRRLAGQKKWRGAIRAARKLPHQSVRLLNIQGCLLAGAKRYAAAGRLFAGAYEKDRGGRLAPEGLAETAKRRNLFWGLDR